MVSSSLLGEYGNIADNVVADEQNEDTLLQPEKKLTKFQITKTSIHNYFNVNVQACMHLDS